ncbi:MAG: baseplate J/gp47 family protein, partial [Acetobacteraceae bacterium]|nr:baseplate J/gp47 family protein [Acetobacteraceae bacterium]
YAVGPPYTPKLKSLSLDFVAEHELLLEKYQPGPASDQIFHVHPFGYAEAAATAPGQGFPFLPSYDNEGELYIGIADLKPPQTLSVLFQMADGSANPDVESRPVTWSILDAGGWRALAGEAILREDSRGLLNSGIIEFALPPTAPDTRLPKGFFWLRAAVESGASGVCDAFTIEAQATSARYMDGNGAPDHYRTPLPPFSITAPVTPVPGIASVRQPFTSFGARPAEEASSFYMAASERLRHKQRAITVWDYERLVLRRFPEVYKAKCLPSALGDDPGSGTAGVLGLVRLVIIPDIRGRSLFDPFEPKASLSLLADIAAYLGPLRPDTARLQVVNAAYVQVRVRVGVRFIDQNNPSFYKQRLNDDLNRYLAPWAYDEGADIVIGQRIYANSLVSFIDERPYVDYVADIKLFRSNDEGKSFDLVLRPHPDDDDPGYYVSSEGRTDAVLVGARQHDVDLIVEEIYKPEEFKGLNYMKVELDFVVG